MYDSDTMIQVIGITAIGSFISGYLISRCLLKLCYSAQVEVIRNGCLAHETVAQLQNEIVECENLNLKYELEKSRVCIDELSTQIDIYTNTNKELLQ